MQILKKLLNINKDKIGFVIIPFFLLTLSFYLGLEKRLWLDEIFTLIYTNVSSFSILVKNIPISGDLNPPFYYLIIFIVRNVFPESIITYRIVSALIALFGLFYLVFLFKNHFKAKNSFIVILLLSISWFYSLYLFIEIRSYGLIFLFFVVFTIFWFKILENNLIKKNDYLGLGLTVLFLFYTHYFSFVYVFPLLIVLGYKKNNKEIYFSLLLIFLFSLPLIYILKNQLEVFHGTTWQEIPSLYQIISLPFTFWGKLFFLVITILHLVNYHKVKKIYLKIFADKNLMLFLYIVFFIPIFVFILSRFSLMVFVERYFILTFIGLAILIGIIVDGLVFESKHKALFLVIFICLGFYYNAKFNYVNKETNEKLDYFLQLDNSGLPVICESPHIFYPLWYYSDKNYNLVLDWESSNVEGNVKNSVFDYYWNLRAKKIYDLKLVLIWSEFINLHDKFYIINEKGRMLFENRITDYNDYTITNVGRQIKFIEKNND